MAKIVENKQPTGAPLPPVIAGDPGYGLGIAGFVVSFFVGIAGIVMSAVALKQSKLAGRRNGLALAGLIIGIVKTVIEVITMIGLIVGGIYLAHYCANNADACSDHSYYQGNGGGQMPDDSQTY